MNRSLRTTPIKVDSECLAEMMQIARKRGVYGNRREADDDSYETLINILVDTFEEEHHE